MPLDGQRGRGLEGLVKKGERGAMNYEATDASRVGRFLRGSGAAATAMILEWLAGTGREAVFDPSSYVAYRVRDASGDVKEFHVPQMLAAMERVSVRGVKANIEDYMERLSNRISEEVWNSLSDDVKKNVKMDDLRSKIYGMLDTSKEEPDKQRRSWGRRPPPCLCLQAIPGSWLWQQHQRPSGTCQLWRRRLPRSSWQPSLPS